MLRKLMPWACLALWFWPLGTALADDKAPEHPLMQVLSEELAYSMKNLVTDDGQKPYFIAYTVTDISSVSIFGQLGALYRDSEGRRRVLDVDVRVGDYDLDNTRKIRGRGGFGGGGRFFDGSTRIALDDNPESVKHSIWQATDQAFKSAVERYKQVVTNQKTMVDEEAQSGDFTREEPSVFSEPELNVSLDRAQWGKVIRNVSRMARDYPDIYSSSVSIGGSAENRFMVTSEGTKLRTSRELWRVSVSASSRAEDGMELSQGHLYDAVTETGLPTEETLRAGFQDAIQKVLALRKAPLVDPYTGPAILMNRASGVFFHEIFGHRIEGHRQKDVDEGQTFAKMVGQSILPEFLDVFDDPTQSVYESHPLRGFYRYDDEGIPGARVDLVKDGVLKTFLMSRSPLPTVTKSNGHGRREPGRSIVSRQGNLIIKSRNQVPFPRLREMLIEECKRQEKPYGFIFADITGGFTTTGRGGPQSFKVLPVLVYRVYTDGRPDELVRGVDIVGTPLSCFSKILCTADDDMVFNGNCGAESGWVPVSAVSPSILVEQIEIEKRERSQQRLPILPAPIAGDEDAATPKKSF